MACLTLGRSWPVWYPKLLACISSNICIEVMGDLTIIKDYLTTVPASQQSQSTSVFHLVLFPALDKVLSWWFMLLSFISNHWRNIKDITEKAWFCSQNGVGKLYGWLYVWTEFVPRTSCLQTESSKPLFHCPDLHRRDLFSCTGGRVFMLIPPMGQQPPMLQSFEQRNHHCRWYWNDMFLSRTCPFLPFFLRQLTSYRQWCAAPHCGIRHPAPPAN